VRSTASPHGKSESGSMARSIREYGEDVARITARQANRMTESMRSLSVVAASRSLSPVPIVEAFYEL